MTQPSIAKTARRLPLLAWALVLGSPLIPAARGQEGEVGEVGAAAAPGAAVRSVIAVVSQERLKLAVREGTPQSSEGLISRNLSRYFAVYLVPSSSDEVARLMGALRRMSLRSAIEIYRGAELLARSRGATEIGTTDVEEISALVLPRSPNRYVEMVFFPDSPHPVAVEEIDLEAFRDTGISWDVLAGLVEKELGKRPDALPLEEEAVFLLADAVNAYGLLVVRVGGEIARGRRDPYLQTRHLREAGKLVAGGMAEAEVKADGAEPGSPAGPRWFVDVTAESGVAFRHLSSDWISRFRRYGVISPTFSGGGVAAADLDGDDWPDLVLCSGEGCSLFRNQRDGTFEDRTVESGLRVVGEARMPLVADFDNDGLRDVFVTYARDTNRLFRNIGEGRFEDVTAESGLEREGDISGPSVALDFDDDGLLDIYVGNFGNYLGGEAPWSPDASGNGMPNRLYHNLGGRKFEDVTESAGVGDTGWAQAVSACDLDLDGDQDLYIANDFGHNELFLNNGDGTFSATGASTGSDDRYHGMNVSFGDVNRDRYPDVYISNIWYWNPTSQEVRETNTLLMSSPGADGAPAFTRHDGPELREHDTGWAWAAHFFDADNDGDDDLYVANGFTHYFTYIQYRKNPEIPDQLYPINNGRDLNRFFSNDGDLPTTLVPESGAELPEAPSRSVALLDYDQDGDLDIAVTTFHSRARLFRNDSPQAGSHWLMVELVGDPEQRVSRDAVGAQLIARGGGEFYAWRVRTAGEGYLGMGTPELELGLGGLTTVDLEVIWPGGERQEIPAVAADRRIRIRQGQAAVEELE